MFKKNEQKKEEAIDYSHIFDDGGSERSNQNKRTFSQRVDSPKMNFSFISFINRFFGAMDKRTKIEILVFSAIVVTIALIVIPYFLQSPSSQLPSSYPPAIR